jgi:hypothetical protein
MPCIKVNDCLLCAAVVCETVVANSESGRPPNQALLAVVDGRPPNQALLAVVDTESGAVGPQFRERSQAPH